jgi:hypothetical protein
MRDVALSLLSRAMEGDGIIRMPIARASDPAIVFLIKEGLIKPLPSADPAGLEIWYCVSANAMRQKYLTSDSDTNDT